jgi:hypothetical protein
LKAGWKNNEGKDVYLRYNGNDAASVDRVGLFGDYASHRSKTYFHLIPASGSQTFYMQNVGSGEYLRCDSSKEDGLSGHDPKHHPPDDAVWMLKKYEDLGNVDTFTDTCRPRQNMGSSEAQAPVGDTQRVYNSGWTKILEYSSNPYQPTPEAVGELSTGLRAKGFAKLSDSMIKFVCGDSYFLRFAALDGRKNMYLNITGTTYNDTAVGMGLSEGGVCVAEKWEDCPQEFEKHNFCYNGDCTSTGTGCDQWIFEHSDWNGMREYETGDCGPHGRQVRGGVSVWCKPRVAFSEETKCPGIEVGDNFLQVGNFRLGANDISHVSVQHVVSGKTSALWAGLQSTCVLTSAQRLHRWRNGS